MKSYQLVVWMDSNTSPFYNGHQILRQTKLYIDDLLSTWYQGQIFQNLTQECLKQKNVKNWVSIIDPKTKFMRV